MNKKCTKCGESKPRSEFSANKGNGDGILQSHCKLCRNKAAREKYAIKSRSEGKTYRPSGPRASVPVPESKKYCPGCKRIKDEEDFHKSTTRPNGLDAYCKVCKHNKYIESTESNYK